MELIQSSKIVSSVFFGSLDQKTVKLYYAIRNVAKEEKVNKKSLVLYNAEDKTNDRLLYFIDTAIKDGAITRIVEKDDLEELIRIEFMEAQFWLYKFKDTFSVIFRPESRKRIDLIITCVTNLN